MMLGIPAQAGGWPTPAIPRLRGQRHLTSGQTVVVDRIRAL